MVDMESGVFPLLEHNSTMFLNDTNSSELVFGIPQASVYTSIVSCAASIIGSSLIIWTFLLWKDIRTVARAILVFLAVADFLTAAGYLFGSIVYLVYQHITEYRNPDSYIYIYSYRTLCKTQSFITTVFPVSSFLWTIHLAIYLFVTIVLRKSKAAKHMLILFHVTAWGIPLMVCLPAVLTGHLGPSTLHSTSIGWCFVEFNGTLPANDTDETETVRHRLAEFYVFELLCGKFWEILAYIVALTLYVSVKVSLWSRRRHKSLTDSFSYGSLNMEKRVTAAIIQLDQKLIWIPVVFILLRMWGTIRLFISFSPSCNIVEDGKITMNDTCTHMLFHPLLIYLQSIGDPAQGWGNALLFVIFNRTIAKRLCPCGFALGTKLKKTCQRCCKKENALDSKIKEPITTSSSRDYLLPISSSAEGVGPPPTYDSTHIGPPPKYDATQVTVHAQNQTFASPESSINVVET